MSGRTFSPSPSFVLAIVAGVAAVPMSLNADVTIISQTRSVVTHASGLTFPPGPQPVDDDSAQASDFNAFDQEVHSGASGAMSNGFGRAVQHSSIATFVIMGIGLGHGEADSFMMSGPGNGRGVSSFDVLFEVPMRARFRLTGNVATTDDVPAGAQQTYPTLTSSLRVTNTGGDAVISIAADRTTRTASVDTPFILQAGQFHLTGVANADITTLNAGLPNITVEATFSFSFTPEPCLADFNFNAVVNSQDFFDFLTAFFAQDPTTDVNGDHVVNSQDFFDFLTAFFAGC